MHLYWAKVREDARIPSKRKEDAGYDLYPSFQAPYLEIAPLETKLVPLGVASAFDEGYVIFLKERGSTGTKGIAQRSGVIDSGYRGEYLCPVTNINALPLRIIKHDCLAAMSEQEKEGYLFYPYEKALCQAVLLPVPEPEMEEISLEDLQEMKSQRQAGRLGSTGK
jgi:dUTP pyrophosphatase